MEAALSLTRTISSKVKVPLSSSSITSNKVITFVKLAGGSFSWAFFSKRILPVDCSRRIADFASSAKDIVFSASSAKIFPGIVPINISETNMVNMYFFIKLLPLITYIQNNQRRIILYIKKDTQL